MKNEPIQASHVIKSILIVWFNIFGADKNRNFIQEYSILESGDNLNGFGKDRCIALNLSMLFLNISRSFLESELESFRIEDGQKEHYKACTHRKEPSEQ